MRVTGPTLTRSAKLAARRRREGSSRRERLPLQRPERPRTARPRPLTPIHRRHHRLPFRPSPFGGLTWSISASNSGQFRPASSRVGECPKMSPWSASMTIRSLPHCSLSSPASTNPSRRWGTRWRGFWWGPSVARRSFPVGCFSTPSYGCEPRPTGSPSSPPTPERIG